MSVTALSHNAVATSSQSIAFDGVSHHALGGGSYAFKEGYIDYLIKLIEARDQGKRVEVNLIIQPNSSPHFGTLFSMAMAFSLTRELQVRGVEAVVVLDLWDGAKAEQLVIDGKIYQRSLRSTGKLDDNIDDYRELLKILKCRYGVPYVLRLEKDFLSLPGIPDVVREIIRERDELGASLAPVSGQLALRAECPRCGLVDKYGVDNVYDEARDIVSMSCPHHGAFEISLETDCARLQFNCQLFNLVIGRYYTRDNLGHSYLQICGSDYAGFWQEQLLWRHLSRPLLIVYTPLIVDWSGSKLSKSLYLKEDAYAYLVDAGMEYMLSYRKFKARNMDLGVICDEVDLWFREPFRLFRCYTVHYVHMLYTRSADLSLGVIHVKDKVNRAS